MAENDLSTLLLRPRRCAADWLIIHARDVAALAERFSSANLLVLACLEARNSIEQLWFEILAVLHAGEITRDFLNDVRSRREGFLAAIRDAEPNYRKLVRYSALCMQLDSVRPVDIITWDLRKLKN